MLELHSEQVTAASSNKAMKQATRKNESKLKKHVSKSRSTSKTTTTPFSSEKNLNCNNVDKKAVDNQVRISHSSRKNNTKEEEESKQTTERTSLQLSKLEAWSFAPSHPRKTQGWSFLCCSSNVSNVANKTQEKRNNPLTSFEIEVQKEKQREQVKESVPLQTAQQSAPQLTPQGVTIIQHQDYKQHYVQHTDKNYIKEEECANNQKVKKVLPNAMEQQTCFENEYFISDDQLIRPMKQNTTLVKDGIRLYDRYKSSNKEHNTEESEYSLYETKPIKTNEYNKNISDKRSNSKTSSAACLTRQEQNKLLNKKEQITCGGTSQQISEGNSNKRVSVISELIKSTSIADSGSNTKNDDDSRRSNRKSIASIIMEMDERNNDENKKNRDDWDFGDNYYQSRLSRLTSFSEENTDDSTRSTKRKNNNSISTVSINNNNKQASNKLSAEEIKLSLSKTHCALQNVNKSNEQLELPRHSKESDKKHYKTFTNATPAQILAESTLSSANNLNSCVPEWRKINQSASTTNLRSQTGTKTTNVKTSKIMLNINNKDGKATREKTPWSSWREEESMNNEYDILKVNSKETSKRSPSLSKPMEMRSFSSLLLQQQQPQQLLSTKKNKTIELILSGKANVTEISCDKPDEQSNKLTSNSYNNSKVAIVSNNEGKEAIHKNVNVDRSSMMNDYTWKQHMPLESKLSNSSQRSLSASFHRKDESNKTDIIPEKQNSPNQIEEIRSSSNGVKKSVNSVRDSRTDENHVKTPKRVLDATSTKLSLPSSSTWLTPDKSVNVLESDNDTITSLPSFGVDALYSNSMSASSPHVGVAVVAPSTHNICKSSEDTIKGSKDNKHNDINENDNLEMLKEKKKNSVNGPMNKEVISSSELAFSSSLNNISANGITSSSLNSRKSILTSTSTWPAVHSSTLSATNKPSSILTSSHFLHHSGENLQHENSTQWNNDIHDNVNLDENNNNDNDKNRITTLNSTTEMSVPSTNKNTHKKVSSSQIMNDYTANHKEEKDENRRKRKNSVENEAQVLTRYLDYPHLNLCMSTFTDIGSILGQSKVLQVLDLRGSTLSSEGLRGLANITTLHTVYLSNMKYLTSLLPLVTPAEQHEENLCSNKNNKNKDSNKRQRLSDNEKPDQYTRSSINDNNNNYNTKQNKNSKVCSLVEIDAHCTSLTNTGIDEISSFLPFLQILDLSMNKITNVSCLRHCRSLRELSLAVTLIDSNGIAGLEELPYLVYLNLARTRVTSLHKLCKSISLQTLIVHSCAIRNEDMIELSSMPSLRQLDVSTTKITNLSPLGNSKSLQVIKAQWLSLKNCFDIIQQRRVMGNEKLCALESLIPNAVREVGYAGLAQIPTLIALDLSFNPIRSMESLCKCPSLQHLILHRTRINSSGVKSIGALSPTLQTLIITNLTDYAEDAEDENEEEKEKENESSEKEEEKCQLEEEESKSKEQMADEKLSSSYKEEWEEEVSSLLKLQLSSPSELEEIFEQEEEDYNGESLSDHTKDLFDCFGLDNYQRRNRTDKSKTVIHNQSKNNLNYVNTSDDANSKNNNKNNSNKRTEKNKKVNKSSLHENGLLSSIDAIASLTSLTTLDLSYTDVYDLRLLEHMKVLRELILIETLITVDGLRGIEKIPTLELLDLSQTSVMTLSFLGAGAAKLKRIIVKSNRNETGFTLGSVTHLPSLQHLDLSDTVVEDAHEIFGKQSNYDNLKNKKELYSTWSLKSLTWRWHERREATGSVQALPCCVKSSTLANLSHVCASLIKLDLSKTNIYNLHFLNHATQLKWLNVSGCTHLHNSALESLVDMNNLEKLSLTGVKHISNVNCLCTLTKLKEIRLNRTSVTLAGIRHIVLLPELRVCHLSSTPAESEFITLMSGNSFIRKLPSTEESRAIEQNSKHTEKIVNNEKGNEIKGKTKETFTKSTNNRKKSNSNAKLLRSSSSSSLSSLLSSQTSCLPPECSTPMAANLTSNEKTQIAKQNKLIDSGSRNDNDNNITDMLTPEQLDVLLSSVHRLMLKVPGRQSHHPHYISSVSYLDIQCSKINKEENNYSISNSNSSNNNDESKHNGSKYNNHTNEQNSLEQVPSFFGSSCCLSQNSSKLESLPFTVLSPLLQTITSTETTHSKKKEKLQSVQSLSSEEEESSLLPVFSSYYETPEKFAHTSFSANTDEKKLNWNNSNIMNKDDNQNKDIEEHEENKMCKSNKENNKYANDVNCAKRHLFSFSINHHLRMNSSLADMSCESIDNTSRSVHNTNSNSSRSSSNNNNSNNSSEVNNCTSNNNLSKKASVKTEKRTEKNTNNKKDKLDNLHKVNVNKLEECVTSVPLEFCLPPPTRVSFVGVDDEVHANAGAIMRKVN